ncbi:transposon Tf2-11 polyprotein [Trichonephila clavipes]|nr:transposon Tf2-11 polyprotein [Trichonephila clavipes]
MEQNYEIIVLSSVQDKCAMPTVPNSVYVTLDPEVHEQMFRLGGQFLATPSVKLPILNFKEFALAQKNDTDLHKFLQTDGSSLKLELKPYQTPDCNLLCDISTRVPRPFIPASFRRALFNHLHNLSHTGIVTSTKFLCSCYVWPSMKFQIKKWTRCWESCQKSKIQRHTKTPLGISSLPDARFSHIHIDIVGLLPPSEGHH